jgi:hypothetical protein
VKAHKVVRRRGSHISLDNRITDGGKVSLMRRPPFTPPPGRFLVLISVRGWFYPRATVRLEGLGKLKISNYLFGSRTRHLPVCSIVPQPTTLRCGENKHFVMEGLTETTKNIEVAGLSTKFRTEVVLHTRQDVRFSTHGTEVLEWRDLAMKLQQLGCKWEQKPKRSFVARQPRLLTIVSQFHVQWHYTNKWIWWCEFTAKARSLS